jgi:aspartyl-tRNA(Asn)/glutamyl-tRNA(Gln) amidotransferase subunit C
MKNAKGHSKGIPQSGQTRKLKLTRSQVEHVARLASLSLTKNEAIKFQKQLSDILRYVAQLEEIETTKVEPTSQVTGLENVFRKDEPSPSLPPEKALSGAKDKHNNYFKIKGIFNET